jgi:hypothetical protein
VSDGPDEFSDDVKRMAASIWMNRALAAEKEVGRLRAIVRVNLMRLEGATHEEIDRILNQGD